MNISARWLYLLAILLLLPALLINLGLLTFIDDEGIRALVTLEMDLSGNLVTPTLHGDYYYKKPPLYNWILLIWYQLRNSLSEFNARIPTVLSLTGYAASIFFILKPKYGTKIAFLNAFFLITCGRVLFWDSMLGLIDMTFSWAMFLLFMVVFHFMEKERYWPLFLLSYLLTAVGFMLKGLPAIVFQGTTLVAYFAYQRRFLKLFSWPHIASGLLFLVVTGGYYVLYNEYNSLENVFSTLFTESSKRTVVEFGLWETVQHLISFPFEMTYHFVPWSLLIILFLRKDIRSLLNKDPFIIFCVLMFLANILIYWSSPEVFPRYLLMHAPLIFIPSLYLFGIHRNENTWQYQLLDRLFLGICAVISLLSFAPLFLEQTQATPFYGIKTLAVAFLLVFASIAYYFHKKLRLVYLVLFLLGVRIAFNFFVLPDRNQNDFGDVIRQNSIRIGQQYRDQALYVYGESEMEPAISFYLTNARGAIIPRVEEASDSLGLYIVDLREYPDLIHQQIDSLPLRHGERPIHIIGTIKQVQ